MLKRIAVTGSISSGKSSLCHEFRKLGAYVVSADQIVSQLLSYKNPVTDQMVKLLGNEIVLGEGLDKKKIADRIFHNPDQLRKVEALLHPEVNIEIERLYQQRLKEKSSGISLFIVEIPLLFEKELESFYDATITVVAPENLRLLRYKMNNNGSIKDFTSRQAYQLSDDEKRKRADFVIENQGTLEELQEAAVSIYKQLTHL